MSYELIIEDEQGDAVDALPVCSRGCARDVATRVGLVGEESMPLMYEPEFDTWCLACGVIMGGSTVEDDTEDCHHRYPVVVNRFQVEEAEVCEHGVTIQQPRRNLDIWRDEQ